MWFLEMLGGSEMDGTGPTSYPLEGFVRNNIETLGSPNNISVITKIHI